MVASKRKLGGGSRLKLGLFASNCSNGAAMTMVDERWNASWENNLRLAQMADAVGLDFMLPIGRWKGFGGDCAYQAESLEAITWACGLLAHTKRLHVASTVHVAFIHPVLAAKQFVTVDHISQGRFGVNIVCGYNNDEFAMFGKSVGEHDSRYTFGEEWLDIVRRIWRSDEPFDYKGRFFDLKAVEGRPKPFGGTEPIIINAGVSKAGRTFSARECDCSFIPMMDSESGAKQVADTAAIAASVGKSIEVYSAVHIVCRKTTKEAQDYYRYYADTHADWKAVDKFMDVAGMGGSQAFPKEYYSTFRTRFAGGNGSYAIVGDPEHCAAELALLAGTGAAGTTITFVNYLDELPFFAETVLPRLEKMGLREPA